MIWNLEFEINAKFALLYWMCFVDLFSFFLIRVFSNILVFFWNFLNFYFYNPCIKQILSSLWAYLWIVFRGSRVFDHFLRWKTGYSEPYGRQKRYANPGAHMTHAPSTWALNSSPLQIWATLPNHILSRECWSWVTKWILLYYIILGGNRIIGLSGMEELYLFA